MLREVMHTGCATQFKKTFGCLSEKPQLKTDCNTCAVIAATRNLSVRYRAAFATTGHTTYVWNVDSTFVVNQYCTLNSLIYQGAGLFVSAGSGTYVRDLTRQLDFPFNASKFFHCQTELSN